MATEASAHNNAVAWFVMRVFADYTQRIHIFLQINFAVIVAVLR